MCRPQLLLWHAARVRILSRGLLRVDTTKALLTHPPFSALPPSRTLGGFPRGTARTTSVSRDLLPERRAGPAGCARLETPANRSRRRRRPEGAQAPLAARPVFSAGTNGGARSAGSSGRQDC